MVVISVAYSKMRTVVGVKKSSSSHSLAELPEGPERYQGSLRWHQPNALGVFGVGYRQQPVDVLQVV